jgi:hypothetical protein
VASAAATAHVNARKTITEMKYRGDIQTPTHAAGRRIADGAPRHLQRRTHHSRTVIVEQRSRHGFDPPSPDTGGRRHRTRGLPRLRTHRTCTANERAAPGPSLTGNRPYSRVSVWEPQGGSRRDVAESNRSAPSPCRRAAGRPEPERP